MLAGCGTASSSGNTSTSKGTPTTTGANAFNPNLVPASGSSPGTTTNAKKKSTKKGANSKSSAHTAKSSSKTTSPKVASPSSGSSSSASSGSSSGKASTVTVSHTSTVTVTKYVRPDVPAGAGLPSVHRDASVTRFDAAGGNIGCRIAGDTVRCDVARRVWTPPRKPASCHAAWGQGLIIGGSGSAFFVCARSSVLDPTGYYMHAGYDDKVGSVTCQVRSFGVTCFESDGHGFFIGRTGYTTF